MAINPLNSHPYMCTRCDWKGSEIATTEHKTLDPDTLDPVRIIGALCPKCFGPARLVSLAPPTLEDIEQIAICHWDPQVRRNAAWVATRMAEQQQERAS